MPVSQQSFAPIPMPKSETPQAVLAVVCHKPQSEEAASGAVGVAAIVRTTGGTSTHWMSGYSQSLDMARAAMVQHLLAALPANTMPQLQVWSTNIEAFRHIPAARNNGGMRSGKNKNKPFAAFALFDPLEAALRDGRWFLQTFRKGEEPGDFYAAETRAEEAFSAAKSRSFEFPIYHKDHPDWHMLEVGNTLTERHEPR